MPSDSAHDPVSAFITLHRLLTQRFGAEVPEQIAVNAVEVIVGVRPIARLFAKRVPKEAIEALRVKPADDGKAFRIRVSLDGTDPEVWRLIDMPTTATFWDLHVAIQDSIGWLDYHLHEFRADLDGSDLTIGIEGQPDDDVTRAAWECYLAPYFAVNPGLTYVYDFGDDWYHQVRLESVVDREPGTYPRCIDGENAGPPEDCGGPLGYEEIKKVLAGRKNATYRSIREWLSHGLARSYWPFDPTAFDPSVVIISTPSLRLKRMLRELAKAPPRSMD